MRYVRATDGYLPISWDVALAKIGAALRALPDPNMAEFYTSGRTSNEAAFLYQLFAREYANGGCPKVRGCFARLEFFFATSCARRRRGHAPCPATTVSGLVDEDKGGYVVSLD